MTRKVGARSRVRTAGPDGIVYVWHWVQCEECGEDVHLRQDGLRPEAAVPGCCGGNGDRSDKPKTHPAEDIARRPYLCAECGYKKEFGEMPKKDSDGAAEAGVEATTEAQANGHGPPHAQPETPRPVRSEPVERRRYHEDLPCRIDEAQANLAGVALAAIIRERKETLNRKRELNAKFREKIAYYDERLEELGEQVEGRVQRKSVEVVEYLLPNNEVQVVRSDTGEVVRTRPAESDDLQEGFDLDAADDDASASGDGGSLALSDDGAQPSLL